MILFGTLDVAITLTLGPRLPDSGEVLRAVLQAIVIVGLGALLGRIVATVPASYRLRDVAGDRTRARRLTRIVFNRATPDSEHEAALAHRCAPCIAVLLRQQAPTVAGLYALIVGDIVLQTFNGTAGLTFPRIFQVVLVAALVIFAFIASLFRSAASARPRPTRRSHSKADHERPPLTSVPSGCATAEWQEGEPEPELGADEFLGRRRGD